MLRGFAGLFRDDIAYNGSLRVCCRASMYASGVRGACGGVSRSECLQRAGPGRSAAAGVISLLLRARWQRATDPGEHGNTNGRSGLCLCRSAPVVSARTRAKRAVRLNAACGARRHRREQRGRYTTVGFPLA